jgi:drug/metabolite transporter (DMT)-like permease
MTRVDGHLSHRGRGLMLLGSVWVLLGVSVFIHSGHSTPGPLSIVPDPLLGVLWIATGAFGVAFSAVGAGRERTKWAFAALLVPVSLRMLSLLVAFVFGLFIGHPYPDALVGSIVWLVVILLTLHEASTPVIPLPPLRERP